MRRLPVQLRTEQKKIDTAMKTSDRGVVRLGLLAFVALTASYAQTWTQLTPTGGPPSARGFQGPTGVSDPGTNRMIVFGGRDLSVGNLNDVWILTNADGLPGTGQWINLIPNGAPGSPPPRSGHVAAYDSASNRMIVFGGCNGGCSPTLNDVWVLTNANGLGGSPAWVQLLPAGPAPAGRSKPTAVYDQANNRLIVFAGQNGSGSGCATFSDVWVLSNANGLGGTPLWSQLSPTGIPYPGQYAPTATYDPVTNRMTVFGGAGIVGGVCDRSNSVAVLTNANGLGGTPAWISLVAEGAVGSPVARAFHSSVYNPANNVMTVFGGSNDFGNFNDVWNLSNANGTGGTVAWSQVLPTGALPPGHDSHAAILDGAGDRMTIFGGDSGGTFVNDTWVLNLNPGPQFNLCLLYDSTKAVRSGATIPIKLQLCNSDGTNLSAPGTILHAISVAQTSTTISGPVQDAGSSNPDSDFRYDPTLGGTVGYIFNLKTTGMNTGSYTLNFKAGSDPTIYQAPFQVK
jgi:hypothetical protein